MMTGLSASLPDIKDFRKTAVINDELRRLNVDVATLQQTRLADSGTVKKKEYTFFWQELVACLLACLTYQQHASVSQGRIYTDNFT